jgi:hypothetical protein
MHEMLITGENIVAVLIVALAVIILGALGIYRLITRRERQSSSR